MRVSMLLPLDIYFYWSQLSITPLKYKVIGPPDHYLAHLTVDVLHLLALARVDRLGGQDTEVYCYYAEDTVEKNILDLAHRRGISLYTSQAAELDTDIAGERVTARTIGRGRTQKGDFVARQAERISRAGFSRLLTHHFSQHR